MTQTRPSRVLRFVAVIASLIVGTATAGCMVTTPDRVALLKGSDEQTVAAKLGAPDLVKHRRGIPDSLGIAAPRRDMTYYYYLDRKYVMAFWEGRLGAVWPIDPRHIDDLKRDAASAREVSGQQ